MEYFEELADIIEKERILEFDELYEAVKETLPEDMEELLNNYMEELQASVPDEEQELCMLMENIKSSLLFLCRGIEGEEALSRFTEELLRFKNWYTDERLCSIDGEASSLMNVLATVRADKITGDAAKYDFTGALDYDINELSMYIS